MAQFHFRNVNDAFWGLVKYFKDNEDGAGQDWRRAGSKGLIVKRQSRNGPVLMLNEPVLLFFEKPRERVLLNAARDANPFFHMFESLWMLAGRNDIAPLAYYAKQIAQYSDDGKTANGAYGYRWRHKAWWDKRQATEGSPGDPWIEETDQLGILVEHLKAQPESRRAVLQMWNVEDDLLKIGGLKSNHPDAGQTHAIYLPSSKDVCCNLSVMFSLRVVSVDGPEGQTDDTLYLDMTVTNRSNDLIWGTLGANVVHFSFLQEYMATRLGVQVGTYCQMSNNLHVYTESNSGFHPEKWLADPIYGDPETGEVWGNAYGEDRFDDGVTTCDHLVGGKFFDMEVRAFIDDPYQDWKDPFLDKVAKPMCLAFKHHKAKQYDLALEAIARVDADDWRNNGRLWLERRRDKQRPQIAGVSGEDSE